MTEVTFRVPGIPRPGGSKRAFLNPRTKRVIVTEDCGRSKDWRSAVALCAAEAFAGHDPFRGPVKLAIVFWMPRPKGHYNSRGILRPAAPAYPTTKPDATKLLRSTEDALKGIAWMDDSQVVDQVVCKLYGNPGADIRIGALDGGSAAEREDQIRGAGHFIRFASMTHE